MLLAGQVHLAERADALGNRSLELGRVTHVNTLGEVAHLHRKDEYRQRECGENADHERIHVKEFLVAAQLTAPGI